MGGHKVLLLGATGVFGSRLAEGLASVDGISLVLASRQLSRARRIADALSTKHPSATVEAVALDRSEIDAALQVIKPWVVVDASGPFQDMDYAVPRQALAAGCHFFDLADARHYLAGFSEALDADARSKGLVALSGVSSSPALSSAAVAALTLGWQRIDTVDMAITPDGIGDVGEAVVLGVLSYAGRHVPQFRFGAAQSVLGWMRGHKVDVPGLGKRWVAPVETSEADCFPSRFKVRSRVAFHAGLESRLEMAGIAILARLRNLGFLQNLKPFVWPMVTGRKVTRMFGGKRGGMLVTVTGLNREGRWSKATWSLLARDGQGLKVPGLPVVAAIRMLLEQELTPGARVACGDIPLHRIEEEFAGLPITSQIKTLTPDHGIIDDALTARDMESLPKPIVDFHRMTTAPVWRGEAQVTRSKGFLARFVGLMIGLPRAGQRIPIRVTVERQADGRERWTRDFCGKRFHSVMNRGPDNSFWEQFGPLNFKLELRLDNGCLLYPVTKARFLGLPLPVFLLPRTDAFETTDKEGRFVFDVKITLPVGGLLVHYRGWLYPLESGSAGQWTSATS